MKLSGGQKEKLSGLLLDSSSEDEIADFLSQKKTAKVLDGISGALALLAQENKKSQEQIERLEGGLRALAEGIESLSRSSVKSIRSSFEETAEKLVEKLGEMQTNLKPKDISFGEVVSALTEIREVQLKVLVYIALEMKNLRRLPEGWFGSGGMDWVFTKLDGTVDGSNVTFTVPATRALPRSDSIVLMWHNGAFKQSDEGDFTRDAGTFTMTTAPRSGQQSPYVLYEK